MNVGYIQFPPALCDVEETISRLENLLPAVEAADLLVLPELCNSGYNFRSREEAFANSETIGDSRFLSYLTDMCRQSGMHVVTGFNEREGEFLYNSAVLLGREGPMGLYRKMHLFHNEKDYFQPGNTRLEVFQCGAARIGMLVCFDWQFPEAWRILALKGADVICHPSNLILPGFAQRAVPAHALVNRLFVVTCNRIGTEGSLTFTGRSIIASPLGELLSEAPEAESHVCVETINPEDARKKAVTPRNDIFKDRRPSDYRDLLNLR